ncbi:MAG: hypothetical protein RLN88_09570 [Ekhidna sp.]|uniref:hypothetical protein n=1 Tax=Ekhidna sp. TaxID=2608089 RepID=UPI0032EC275D
MLTLKINWKYCVAFYFVIMLHVSIHELVHHFAGFLICGDFGYKTFNYFETACAAENDWKYLATYMGPMYTYVLMYVGMMWLRRDSSFFKHLGFATIFAQLPFQRMTGPIFGFNDEYFATAKLIGGGLQTQIIVTIILFAICIPPLLAAYKSIENKNRMLWFLWYYLLFPYLLFGPFFGTFEYLMVNKGILSQTIIGIGLLFIINEVVTIIGHIFTSKWIDPEVS